MPRNMSFFLTQNQIREKTKFVTRRNGWVFLQAGDILNAKEKCQGLKKGEKQIQIGQIEVVSVRLEPLFKITPEDVILEGFPKMTTFEFIDMYKTANKCDADQIVTRIEFKYL